ncbi:MAG: tetratricopeptide repeat protein [Armatimonadetes bacterium]|nr:tetratricopeptide repeat protein [Armatimonadota bacterium]
MDYREEIARLEQKLAESDDPDIQAALRLKIASIRVESESPAEQGEAKPAGKAEKPALPPLSEDEKKSLEQELYRLQVRYDESTDEDMRDALDVSIQRIHRRIAGFGLAPDASESEVLPIEATPEAIREAEDKIRRANLERLRGNNTARKLYLDEAIKIAPDAPIVLTAMAELQLELGKVKEAAASVEEAKRRAPNDPNVERLQAAIAVRIDAGKMSIEDQMAMMSSDSFLIDSSDRIANAKIAGVLSFFLPGLGHLVLGRKVTGFTLLAMWLCCFVWIVLRRADFQNMMKAIFGKGSSFNASIFIPMFGAFACVFIAVAGCGALAKRGDLSRMKVDAPTPPVNLPYE